MSDIVDPMVIFMIRTSPELNELYAALSAAQAEITDPPKAKTANVPTKAGGSYSYKYADLADILKIVRPVFAKHGLCVLQFPVNPMRVAVTVVTRLGHKSGQWIEAELTLPVADDRPQTIGSAITYARRYSLGGIAGLAPDEDEDGNIAQTAAIDRVPKSRATKVTMVSHDTPPPPVNEIYDPHNKSHESRLMAQLNVNSVPKEKWGDIGLELEGKTMVLGNIDAAIKKAMKT